MAKSKKSKSIFEETGEAPPVEEIKEEEKKEEVDLSEDKSSDKDSDQEIDRLRQETSQLRSLVDHFLITSTHPNQPASIPQGENIFDLSDEKLSEEIAENPRKILKQVVDQTVTKIQEQFEQRFQEINIRNSAIQSHPEAYQLIRDTKFQEWVRSNIPISLAHQADRDPSVMRFVIDSYKKQYPNTQSAIAAQGLSPNTSGGESNFQRPIFTRAELMDLKIKDPVKYKRLQSQIIAAYQAGRVK